jgi:hypothetical protein
VHLDPLPGEGKRDPPGADRELEDRAGAGEGGQRRDGRVRFEELCSAVPLVVDVGDPLA